MKTAAHVSAAFDPNSTSPHPQQVQFDAIWDTGATNSVISQKVVDACGLKPIGMAIVHTGNGSRNSEVYFVNIILPNGVRCSNVRVTKGDMAQDTHLLIGMDIIGVGDFAVTHKDGKTCFSFRCPSTERIDFVKPQPIHSAPKQARNDKCACGSGKKFKHCCGKDV
ncbi:MAG: retroviral-like aspartic protease family protein [Verrucomicrobia bacterium]|nr:retroviral-like aspartic protease family protein [Verrucomicrobiota bacterium]